MPLAVRSRLAALGIEPRSLPAEVMRAIVAVDFHHTVRRMYLAVRRLLAARDIEAWLTCAGAL